MYLNELGESRYVHLKGQITSKNEGRRKFDLELPADNTEHFLSIV